MSFPEHSLNLDRVDGAFAEPGGARRYLSLGISLIYQGTAPVDLRMEVKDAVGGGRFTRLRIQPSPERQTLRWDFRSTYTRLASDLDLTQAKLFSFIVERNNQADGVSNPNSGTLIVDKLWFTPDRAETQPVADADLLDLAGRRSCQYFVDWSSRKTASQGIPQDRSTLADLLTVGGIGFALPCYAIAAERGWITRADAAGRTLAVLRLIADPKLYCAGSIGCIGYRGWLYHFLGPDGRRKQNFDVPGTPAREDRNTVEISSIDTTLALMGALAAQSYFNKDTTDERDIRALAQQIYDFVDWNFMLESKTNRFFYGWKPTEDRDNTEAEFLWADAEGKGHYSSYQSKPQVIDLYTDEGFLMTLLALGSSKQNVPVEVHCAPGRDRVGGLVKTWPGSLFTFFFARAFLATEQFDLRPCPDERPVNWLENSRLAFQKAIKASLADAWGISATEGPADKYAAYGLPELAIDPNPAQDGTVTYYGMLSASSFGADLKTEVVQALRAAWARGHWQHRFGLPDAFNMDALKAFPAATSAMVEVEGGSGDGGAVMQRSAASGKASVLLLAGQVWSVPVTVTTPGWYRLTVRTSNDNNGPLETVTILVDGVPSGSFQPPDTHGLVPGAGWNVFTDSILADQVDLLAGSHVIKFEVAGGDGYEMDFMRLDPVVGSDVRAWVNRARFAIDEGPAALHIENARSGLVWALIEANPNIQRATKRLVPVQTFSAASGLAGATSESLVSSFGAGLPQKDVTIKVFDSAGALLNGKPFFDNSNQANWVTPSGAATGEATVTIRGSDASAATGTMVFSRLAPALFSANASGQGVAAANLIRVINGVQTLESVAQYDAVSNQMVPIPIRFGSGEELLYLILYGTGLRTNAGLGECALRIAGETVPVGYCKDQPAFLGLDQVNAGPLPRSLAGRGAVEVNLTVGGQRGNTVTLLFQ